MALCTASAGSCLRGSVAFTQDEPTGHFPNVESSTWLHVTDKQITCNHGHNQVRREAVHDPWEGGSAQSHSGPPSLIPSNAKNVRRG